MEFCAAGPSELFGHGTGSPLGLGCAGKGGGPGLGGFGGAVSSVPARMCSRLGKAGQPPVSKVESPQNQAP